MALKTEGDAGRPAEKASPATAVLSAELREGLDGAGVGVKRGQHLHRPPPRREQPADESRDDARDEDRQALRQRRRGQARLVLPRLTTRLRGLLLAGALGLGRRAHALIAASAFLTPSTWCCSLVGRLPSGETLCQGRKAFGRPSSAGSSSG